MSGISRLLIAMATLAAAGPSLAADPAQAAAKAGCTACHAADKKTVGPSVKEIAARYKGDAGAVATLSSRVRKGSSGVWGAVPMVPVDTKTIGDADLKAVLSAWLKGPG
jgi:cytochrome c